MTFRKRRSPTPALGFPPPFNPTTGEHATLRTEGIYPYCAMMQVAASDTYEDYVVCRGFDPRIRKFIDYPPGISVAKPFGNRQTGSYTVGEVYPAFLPTQGPHAQAGRTADYTPPSPTAVAWRVGQNPGTASPELTGGHPQNLSATISELIDHNSQYVQWMLIDSGSSPPMAKVQWGVATSNWVRPGGGACDYVPVQICDDCEGNNPTGDPINIVLPQANDHDPNVIAGQVIAWTFTQDGDYVCVSDYMDAKIGTVWFTTSTGAVPAGWAVMDGTSNSAGNGGTGINATGRFIKGSASNAGTTGGQAQHTHVIDVHVDPHTAEDIDAAINIHVGDHTTDDCAHQHQIVATPYTHENEVYPGNFVDPVSADHPPDCTMGPVVPMFGTIASGTCVPISDTVPWALFHKVTWITRGELPYLEHVVSKKTCSEEEHEPEYVNLIPIERLDNSA